jgi:hypothetical protein
MPYIVGYSNILKAINMAPVPVGSEPCGREKTYFVSVYYNRLFFFGEHNYLI